MAHTFHQRAPTRLAAVLALALAAGVTLAAHLAVSRTFPLKDARLSSPPDHLQVWFTQEPELPVSGLRLQGPGGAVTLGKVEGGGERSIRARIDGSLAHGDYTATWKTAGDDGHVMQGTFRFTIVPPPR